MGDPYLDDVQAGDDIRLYPLGYRVRGSPVRVSLEHESGGLRLWLDGVRLRELELRLDEELHGLDMLEAARVICERVVRVGVADKYAGRPDHLGSGRGASAK